MKEVHNNEKKKTRTSGGVGGKRVFFFLAPEVELLFHPLSRVLETSVLFSLAHPLAMAPRGTGTWRRPYTSIYNDNYRYGTGLYSDTLSDIEKRYSDSLSKTQLRSDRPDLTFTSFSGSNLTSSPSPRGEARDSLARQTSRADAEAESFESRMRSSYALDDEVQDVINRRNKLRAAVADTLRGEEVKEERRPRSVYATPEPTSLYDDATFWSLPKSTQETKVKESKEFDVDSSFVSRRKVTGGHTTTTNGPSSHQWREKRHIERHFSYDY
ncbi:UNVERIFIED_CONTAM: hypothetical protein NCL1_08439 [Trichonephila clavipes]